MPSFQNSRLYIKEYFLRYASKINKPRVSFQNISNMLSKDYQRHIGYRFERLKQTLSEFVCAFVYNPWISNQLLRSAVAEQRGFNLMPPILALLIPPPLLPSLSLIIPSTIFFSSPFSPLFLSPFPVLCAPDYLPILVYPHEGSCLQQARSGDVVDRDKQLWGKGVGAGRGAEGDGRARGRQGVGNRAGTKARSCNSVGKSATYKQGKIL